MDCSPMGKREKDHREEKIQRGPPLGNQAGCNANDQTYRKNRSLRSNGQTIEPNGEERERDP